MKIKTIIGIIVIVVLIGVYLLIPKGKSGVQTLGGSIGSDSYYSTTTDGTWSLANFPTQFKVIKNGPGILGSVVITQAIAGALNLYDGTTTSSHANLATTTLARLGASVAAGTYTFDTAFSVGLIAEFPTALGVASSTITWK